MSASTRIHSIDVLRAVTMLLMIFVNDFWTLTGIPQWLKHMPAEGDGLGFSDIIFPAFLVIVGLSLPFAVRARRQKGQTTSSMAIHILVRSLSLIIMGVLMVNLEHMQAEGMPISKPVWQLLMATAFFLIWNRYPKMASRFHRYAVMQLVGWGILIYLASIYQGGTVSEPTWMQTHWWGILGLIGWAYLVCALIYLLSRGDLRLLVASWIFFLFFNVAAFAGWLDFMAPIQAHVWLVGDGAFAAFTMSGVVAGRIYQLYYEETKDTRFIGLLVALSVVMFVFALVTRPYWGISKIQATPAWIGHCTAITLAAFAFFYWLIDQRQIRAWSQVIAPAGTSTLTCYLIPYFYYPIVTLLGLSLPLGLKVGIIGLAKSMLVALAVVIFTGILQRWRIQLKL